jgi:2-oxoglutarate-Fe(II)-dependent oxygenase superfamily protein
MNKTLFKLNTRIKKFSLSSQENIELTDFTNVSPKDVTVVTDPFPHFVVENFFKPEVYEALSQQFNDVKKRGLSKDKTDNRAQQFHAFDIDYDGYVYRPAGTIDPKDPLSVFYSLAWNGFFSKVFDQFTTFETMFAFHHHPAGDRTGFVHHDYSEKRFNSNSRLPNGVICGNKEPCDLVRRRIISILFYLNNDSWKLGDGGETGIYSADQKTLLKTVPPISNSLFAFQTSKRSMHAFQSNKTERNSFVQWFHIPSELL